MKTPTKRILLVDDEDIFRLAVARLLETEGFDCTTVENAGQAKEQLRESFDLIISDVRMDGNMNLEFFHYVSACFPSMPIIVVTGYPSVPPKLGELPRTVVRCLTKPFDGEELFEAIRLALGTDPPSEEFPLKEIT